MLLQLPSPPMILGEPIPATNEIQGVIRIATDAEAATGTAENLTVNPKQLADAVAAALLGMATGRFKVVQFTGVTLDLDYVVTHNLDSEALIISVRDTVTHDSVSFSWDTQNNMDTVEIILLSVINGRVYEAMILDVS